LLDGLGLTFEGRQHSGIDDSANIARIMKELALLGHVFENTTSNSL
jgi:inhibitor of KinA sporulation pathway (predicted exonuclease)